MGKLQGIKISPDIRPVVATVLALPQSNQEPSTPQKSDDDGASSPSTSPRSMSASSPSALLAQVQAAKHDSSRTSLTSKEARSVLENASNVLPLAGVQAVKFLINNSTSDPHTKSQLLQQLESALRQTTLSFEPNPTSKTSNPAFNKRLERLRLQDEERSYMTLTTNLKTAASLKDDNVTAKSMMYATSVGLNMVVAPISFGVFMYFFAGSIFSRFFDSDEDDMDGRPGNNVDIRRVIAGVVSGVFMLFVEMILFVIRSHELDASVRKKSKRKENRANPFGYTQKSMERVYVRDD